MRFLIKAKQAARACARVSVLSVSSRVSFFASRDDGKLKWTRILSVILSFIFLSVKSQIQPTFICLFAMATCQWAPPLISARTLITQITRNQGFRRLIEDKVSSASQSTKCVIFNKAPQCSSMTLFHLNVPGGFPQFVSLSHMESTCSRRRTGRH